MTASTPCAHLRAEEADAICLSTEDEVEAEGFRLFKLGAHERGHDDVELVSDFERLFAHLLQRWCGALFLSLPGLA